MSMSLVVHVVFSVTGALIALFVGAAWWRIRPGSRSGRRLLAGSAVFYTLASLYVVPFAASRVLSYGFRPFSAVDGAPATTAIVVLGSGAVYTDDWQGRELVLPDLQGAARLFEAFRVYGLVRDAWIISSGGAVNASGRPTTGGAMGDALNHLGVPVSRIVLEGRSRTTYDEAVLIAPMLRDLKATRVILVTSDFHMRRSLATFRAAGIEAVPAIARDPFSAHSWAEWLTPSNQALLFSGSVVHEVLGIAYYAVRGRLQT